MYIRDDLDAVDGPLVVTGTSVSWLPPAQLDPGRASVAGKVIRYSSWSQELRRPVYRQRPPLNTLQQHN